MLLGLTSCKNELLHIGAYVAEIRTYELGIHVDDKTLNVLNLISITPNYISNFQ